ncbi:spirocyclase AveC family protein [Nocardioides humilatus]|uniref:spirocyclase AveC family protein n=1 Tax=Nocardioides humilatus TaxID=2607660 RepID=UPI00165F4C2D|nr:spirocyclase AveC family protein [Nocardioides humilatus]
MTARRWPVAALAATGSVALLVQIVAYGAWLTSGKLGPVRSIGPVPADVARNVHAAELTLVGLAAVWLVLVGWTSWQQRGLTWPLLWTAAWASAYWQEPLVNARRRTFSFNDGFVNFGDWTTHLPFVPDSYQPLPEALLLEGLVFLALLPALTMVVAGLVGWLLRRGLGRAVAFVVGYVAVVAFDVCFELAGISQDLLAYVEVGGPALRSGDPDQWPLYEGVAIGAAWAFPGLLTAARRDRGDAACREVRPRWWGGRWATLVTLLAAVGVVNVVFGLYNAGYLAIMAGTVADQPPWLGGAVGLVAR